jgi:hypothetical protein
MTTKILMKEQIKSEVLKVLSGYCFDNRKTDSPKIVVLSPWISNVNLQLDDRVYELDTSWFGHDYGISSIPLATALLYLKLDFGADISLVTLPPVKKNYQSNATRVSNFLDFLDEIGCYVFTNQDLHTKLILSNDLALIGSFNLTFQALWGREEIGVSVDDMENLKILEDYADKIVRSSETYGYTGKIRFQREPTSPVTRGWLFGKIVEEYYSRREHYSKTHLDPSNYHEFLFFHFRTITAQELLKMVIADFDGFYMKVLRAYLESEEISDEEILDFLKYHFEFQGKHESGEILTFLKTKFARKHIPQTILQGLKINYVRRD